MTRSYRHDPELTERHALVRQGAERVAKEVYAPRAPEWEKSGEPLPQEERLRLAALGYLGCCLSEDCGGSGAELLEGLIVIEELAKECQLAAFQVFEANTGAARVIDLLGTSEQKARLLPPVIAGEKTIAVAMSEADAGSAVTDLNTHAYRDDDTYVVNGMKRWCSGAGHAEQYLVYVRLNEQKGASGIGAVVIDKDSAGVSFGSQEEYMGFRGIPSADFFLNDVRVPVENLIIGAGGFKRLFTAFSIERLANATMSLAIGQACLERTAQYVQDRKQFGKDIIDFQMVQSAIADMVVDVEAARLLIYRAAVNADSGFPLPLEVSVAKCFANEMAKRVSDHAIMLHGGYGYATAYGIERYHRDALGWAIAGGTPSLQRVRIVTEYLKRKFDQRPPS